MDIPSTDRVRESMKALLAQTRYSPKIDVQTDEHGMPVLAPEPDDPDDDYGEPVARRRSNGPDASI